MLNNDVGVRGFSHCESLWIPCAMTNVTRNVVILCVAGTVLGLGGGGLEAGGYKYAGRSLAVLGLSLVVMSSLGAILDCCYFSKIRRHQQQLLAPGIGMEMAALRV